MGQARLSCPAGGGCECKDQVIDGHEMATKTSTTFMAMFKTYATAEGCTVHVSHGRPPGGWGGAWLILEG